MIVITRIMWSRIRSNKSYNILGRIIIMPSRPKLNNKIDMIGVPFESCLYTPCRNHTCRNLWKGMNWEILWLKNFITFKIREKFRPYNLTLKMDRKVLGFNIEHQYKKIIIKSSIPLSIKRNLFRTAAIFLPLYLATI